MSCRLRAVAYCLFTARSAGRFWPLALRPVIFSTRGNHLKAYVFWCNDVSTDSSRITRHKPRGRRLMPSRRRRQEHVRGILTWLVTWVECACDENSKHSQNSIWCNGAWLQLASLPSSVLLSLFDLIRALIVQTFYLGLLSLTFSSSMCQHVWKRNN